MAKKRYINTKFWDDNFVTKMDSDGKLLFVYLLTNPLTNISGIYEIPLKRMVFDTDIEEVIILDVIDRLSKASKVFYIDGWVYIRNFIKHQSINPNVEKGIKAAMSEIPDNIKEKIQEIDRLSKALNNLDFNPDLNLDFKSSTKIVENPPVDLLKESGRIQEEKNTEKPKPEESDKKNKSYGNERVNLMLGYLKKNVGCDDFTESQKTTRIWAKNILALMDRITKPEFACRVESILADDFKKKNCNSLKYFYNQIKAWIEPSEQIIYHEDFKR